MVEYNNKEKQMIDKNYDIYSSVSGFLSVIEKYNEYEYKLLNIGFIFNNKIFEIYNYIKSKGFEFDDCFISKATEKYFYYQVLSGLCLLHECIYSYVKQSKKRFFSFKQRKKRIELLDKYNTICNDIYNFSITNDIYKIYNYTINDIENNKSKYNNISIDSVKEKFEDEMMLLDIDNCLDLDDNKINIKK